MKRKFYLPLLIVLLVSLVFGILPLGQPLTVYAAPGTENLWSGSNSAPNLTLTNSTNADGSGTDTWANATGSKWATKNYSWTFTMADSAVGAGTINSVTLYLKHYQNGWANDNYQIQVFDGFTTQVVFDTAVDGPPPTADTTDNWTVTILDTWPKINAAQVIITGISSISPEETETWYVDTVELRIDYTPPPDISNTPSTWGFGTVDANSSYVTGINYVVDSSGFKITNNSAYNVNITISAGDMTGGDTWLLADSGIPDGTHYALWAGTEDTGGAYSITVTSTGAALTTVLASGGTKDWGLKLMTPMSFSDGGSKSGTITLTATPA